ncbi:hypothetical protein ACFPZE_07080 [Pseudoxanthomonas mexicana]|jgi:hypothetical protein
MAASVHGGPFVTENCSSGAIDGCEGVADTLVALHGELMDSQALVALFKFGSERSFRRSASKGALPVTVFRVPGRRGWFARTRDVAAWLAELGSHRPVPSKPRVLSD